MAASPTEVASEATLMADPEWRLVLAACSSIPPPEKQERIRRLLRNSVRWEVIRHLADRHGVQPLLCQILSQVKDIVPCGEMSKLEVDYRANLHRVLFLARELVRIIDHLSAIGVDVMPYKGLAVAEAAYRDIALRQTGDIDLLIHARDLRRIRAAVGELGFTPHAAYREIHERDYLKSGYELAFDGEAGPNLLELQWAIQPRFYAIDFDMEGVFRRAMTIEVAGHPMKTPCFEDLVLTLSAHAAKHGWSRLVWLCDIARLMAFCSLDWEWIVAVANNLGIVRILHVTLFLAHQLLDVPLPASMHSRISNDREAAMLAGEVQSHMAGATAHNVESLAYFQLMLRLRERPADRMRLLSRLVSTPGPGEWEAVHLPPLLSPLYRVVRLARLTVRFMGRRPRT